MKIKIDISDRRLFSDIAHIVDQQNYLQEIERARDLFNINEPWGLEKYHKYKRSIYKSEKSDKLKTTIENIRIKLMLPKVFIKAIESSIFLGVVTDDDYSPAILISEINYFDDKGEIPDYTYSIILSPRVKDTQVIKALQEYRDQLGNTKGIANYSYIPEPKSTPQRKSATRNHREWYWLNKQGKSIEEIWKASIESCPIDSDEHFVDLDASKCTCNLGKTTVSDGIKAYGEFLRF